MENILINVIYIVLELFFTCLKQVNIFLKVKKKKDILFNKYNNKIKKDTDDPILNNLIKKLVVIDPHERMEWKDYFDDPFFKENDEDVKESEECKIKN